MNPGDEPATRSRHPDAKPYRITMGFYLVTAILLLPHQVPILLADLGIIRAMGNETMPTWLYGYAMTVVMTLFPVLLLAPIPLAYVCIRFVDRWLVTVPPCACLLTADIALFAGAAQPVLDVAYGLYTLTALTSGILWVFSRGSRGSGRALG